MNGKFLEKIPYLEGVDFNSDGTLKVFGDKTKIVMVQANFCGHCIRAKPEFQKAKDMNTNKNVVFCTIQGDGGESEKQAMMYIKPHFSGFPTYMIFDKNGKMVTTFDKRDANSLLEIASDFKN